MKDEVEKIPLVPHLLPKNGLPALELNPSMCSRLTVLISGPYSTHSKPNVVNMEAVDSHEKKNVV